MSWRLRRARVRDDSGAAALEFALVSFVLFPLVFGIIDYGIFFADASGVRSGARDGARQGVVGRCSTMQCLADLTKSRIDTVAGGTTYVRISAEGGWERGNDLLVCAAVKVDGLTGLTPFPNGGLATSRVTMRIEQDVTMDSDTYDADNLPAGADWDFCT